MLIIGTVTIADPWREPPKQPHSPFPRRTSYSPTFDTSGFAGEVVQDFGQDVSKPLRLVSDETVGFLTKAEVDGLEALYNMGVAFALVWDRFPDAAPLGQALSSKIAYFDPTTPPLFTLVNEQKDLWYMDILLRIVEQPTYIDPDDTTVPVQPNYDYEVTPDDGVVVTATASRYAPASTLVAGSTAFAGAEGPGRMAAVNPTKVFFITTLSDLVATPTDLGGGMFSGSFRTFCENMPAGTVAIPLVGGSILMSQGVNLINGRKRFGGEFMVPGGIGLCLKMRNTTSSIPRLSNGNGFWNSTRANPLQIFGGNNVIQFLRICVGTGDWTIKQNSGSCIRVASSDNYIGNCDMSLASDQSAGATRGGMYRTTWADNFCGQPIDHDLHSENGGVSTQSHGRGPLMYGAYDQMWLRSAFFQLKDRQVAWSLLDAIGHQFNTLMVGCLRGAVLQSKDAQVNGTHMFVNIIKNYFIPGPLSSGQNYEHYLSPLDAISVRAEGNVRHGTVGFRDSLGNGFGRSLRGSAPITFLDARIAHPPVREMAASELRAYTRDWVGVCRTRNPLTGAMRDVRDSLHRYNKSWIDDPSKIPTATLTAAPTAAQSTSGKLVRPWVEVDPTIPSVSMTHAAFMADYLEPWIAREFPGASILATRTSAAGRTATVIEHFLDACVWDNRAANTA